MTLVLGVGGRGLLRRGSAVGSDRGSEQGFTLIEVMVVLLIMAILVVIGLPTFLGVIGRFRERAAQQDLRVAVTAARVVYTDSATFASAVPATLTQVEPSVCYVDAAVASVATGAVCPGGQSANVSVGPSLPTTLGAARMGGTGSCFLISDSPSGTLYGTTSVAADCTGAYASSGVLTATSPQAAGW